MKTIHFLCFITLALFMSMPVVAACTPCTVTYTLQVHYRIGLVPQLGTITGSAQVFDGVLDLNAGPVQNLLASQINSAAVLVDVNQLTLNGQPGAAFTQNDTLLAANGGVIAWIDAPNGATGRLHFTTLAAQTLTHPFNYVYRADGTESPPVGFTWTVTATGNETFRAPAHTEQRISIAHYDPNAAECRNIEGDVCLPVGSKRQSSRLDEGSSSKQIDHQFFDSGDRCVHYRIEVSSTNVVKKMCNGSKDYNCSLCGAWYEGTVVLDGFTDTLRGWTRSVSGNGQAEGKPQTNFTINYASAGGVLGSGLPDTSALSGSPSYTASLANCNVGGTPIPCSNLGVSMNGNTLTVSTVQTRPVATSKNGSSTLASTDGTKAIDSLAFIAENNDVRHTAEVTYQNILYIDANADGFVDVGPFSFWSAGVNGDQLMGTFDRTGFPVATIDSIAPKALFGQSVQFIGHGSGPFTTYQWFTHRLDQAGGPLLGAAANISRNNLNAGVHQIRFQVAGTNASPFTFRNLIVNQPPVAFINHIENVNDPAHPSTSLLLHDGAQTDPFSFDGGGIDFDGSITAWEWSSNIEPGNVFGNAALLQKSLTALGTHTVSFRVRDNQNVWSAAVKQTVVVRRPPVLTVHGVCGDNTSFDDVVNNGWLGPQWTSGDIVRRTFDANGDGITNDAPADNAQLIWQQIQQMKTTYGVGKVNIIAHSMGGLGSRAYIESPAYQGDVNKLVMLSTPNHGSSIADLTLMSNGYSQEDVELYVPIRGVQELLTTLGVVVDIVDWLDPNSGLACLGQDSPALHALRPHSEFLRNLNHTLKDEGTEDYGASGQPNDFVSPNPQYFAIHGSRTTVSHTHLPQALIDSIRVATLGQVNLNHMSLIWARDGDAVVTSRSARLDGIPSDHFDHRHRRMQHEADSVGKGLFYLLDDPPLATSEQNNAAAISGVHLLGAGRGTVTTLQTSSPITINVDNAAQRLRISVTWSDAATPVITSRPIDIQTLRVAAKVLLIVLTSPSGVRFSSDAGRRGFTIAPGNGAVDVSFEKPEAGAWKLEVIAPADMTLGRGGLPYTWLAFEESGAFVALGLSAENVEPGETVTIAAYVQNNATGVIGAEVRAAVSNGKEKPVPVTFTSDSRFPGLYTAKFTPSKSGTFRVLAAAKIPADPVVTRFDFLNFEARLLPDLRISLSGNATTLTAKADNRGKSAATKIPVRFFDGLPAQQGRLLAERILNLAPASSASVSIPWVAKAGVHRLVAVIDPSNTSGEANTTDNVATMSLEVKDTTLPVARAGADQTAAIGQSITVDGRASTDDDRIASYRWNVVSEEVATRRFAIDPAIDGSYLVLPGFAAAGSYTVRLTVTDASGNRGTDDLVVRVVAQFDSEPPVANAGSNPTVAVGAPVQFNGLASHDKYGIALATWDVDLSRDSDGDGNPSNDQDLAGLSPTLQPGYSKAGNYRARLTVRDAVGNGPSTADVLVRVGMVIDPTTATPLPDQIRLLPGIPAP
ncbi:MAG: hypothetical protein JWO97_1516 [Acidobacteria bacterium]|nr:hypothetical protein [Acidobacteriota bacterium]